MVEGEFVCFFGEVRERGARVGVVGIGFGGVVRCFFGRGVF